MLRFRQRVSRRCRGTPADPEKKPLLSGNGEREPSARLKTTVSQQQDASSASASDEAARLFALRHLSRALTSLERGILRLEHGGGFKQAFRLRTLWTLLLNEYVGKGDGVEYEVAACGWENGGMREDQVDRALTEIGNALVLAEATMARWEWVPWVVELRKEVSAWHERYGKALPEFGV